MIIKKIALLGQQALNPGRLALLPERLQESKEASGKCHARQGEGGGAMASHHTEQGLQGNVAFVRSFRNGRRSGGVFFALWHLVPPKAGNGLVLNRCWKSMGWKGGF